MGFLTNYNEKKGLKSPRYEKKSPDFVKKTGFIDCCKSFKNTNSFFSIDLIFIHKFSTLFRLWLWLIYTKSGIFRVKICKKCKKNNL